MFHTWRKMELLLQNVYARKRAAMPAARDDLVVSIPRVLSANTTIAITGLSKKLSQNIAIISDVTGKNVLMVTPPKQKTRHYSCFKGFKSINPGFKFLFSPLSLEATC